MTLTNDQIQFKMEALCRAQAEANALKAELEPFIQTGESLSCQYGKLTMVKGHRTFKYNKEGEALYEAHRQKLIDDGMGEIVMGSPSLRLTLNKEKVTA